MQALLPALALVVALAAPGATTVALAASTPTPFPFGTLQPFGTTTPPPTTLPPIGRVRAATTACTAMRDLVIPSFATALKSDAVFAQSSKRLPQYIDFANDKSGYQIICQEVLLEMLTPLETLKLK